MIITIDRAQLCFAFVLNAIRSDRHTVGEAELLRTYTQLSADELRTLYKNTTGFVCYSTDYNALLQVCRFLGLRYLQGATAEQGATQ